MVKKKTWDNVYDVKTVSAKLSQSEFTNFKTHCDQKGLTPSAQIKKLIEDEIKNPIPINLAGRNVFAYNKNKDNFSWSIMLDKGLRVDVEDDLSPEYILQLAEEAKRAVDERNTYLKKESKDTVPVPNRLVRKGL